MVKAAEYVTEHTPEESLKLFMQSVLDTNMSNENRADELSSPIKNFQESLDPLLQPMTLFLDLLQNISPNAINTTQPESTTSEPHVKIDTDEQSGTDSESHLKRWMDLGCEYNKRLLTDSLGLFANPTQRCHGIIDHFTTLSNQLMQGSSSPPTNLLSSHLSLMLKQLELGENLVKRLAGTETSPVIHPCKTDHRFSDSEWETNLLFDFIKQSYLLNSQAVMSLTDGIDLDPQNKALLDYCLRQVSSALSPSNFAFVNPEVLRKIEETNGENIYKGIKQFLEDQANSSQYLNICMSDSEKFKLGENIATTKGKIVYENELIQLIQYEATTDSAFSTPLLMIPSWINKYYILDLSPANSFVQWAVNHGITVFMISWVNPDQNHRHLGFEDYLQLGILKSVDTIQEITGEKQVNAAGYCLGGILLATAMAYLSHHKKNSIKTATYLAASLDYTDPGDISIFCTEKIVKSLEEMMEKEGYLDGRLLSVTFNLLRENELYWNFYIQNYLKGERPKAFDVLHWNTDNTNVPVKAHSFVLRDLHLDNALIKKGSIKLLDTPIDLKKVQNPTYILATDKDHIAKWESAYSATQLHSGDKRFVLAGSGHVAGVINPPINNKYYYLTNENLPKSPKTWLKSAHKHAGSWWNDWLEWIKPQSGNAKETKPIQSKYVLESAPGRYVRKRLS